MIAPQDYAVGSAGLEPAVGARNRRKATVKIRRNVTLGALPRERDYTQKNVIILDIEMGERNPESHPLINTQVFCYL